MRPPRPHPCWPVPASERRRLVLIARLSLAELQAGQVEPAITDLAAVAAICRELLAADRFTDDARQAAQEAAQAIEAVQAGTTPPAAALGPATSAVEMFERLLGVVTLRRLEAAKVAAAKDC